MLISSPAQGQLTSFLPFTWILLGAALGFVACEDEDKSTPRGGGGTPSTVEPPIEAGVNAGGRSGCPGSRDGGGAAGVGETEPNPVVEEPPDQGPPDEDPPDENPADEDPPDEDPPDEDPPDEDPPDEDPPDEDPPDEELGLPCDVAALLRARCQSCHSASPVSGTNLSLRGYADLASFSKVVPTVTVAARALHRMKDSLTPMPPTPVGPATLAEVAVLQGWMDAGLPRAKCDDDPNPSTNPYDAPITCTSGSYWPGNHTGAPWMMPGAACITCHRQYLNFAPLFTVAGTVFPTAHEPDKCYGVPVETGAKVVITDANGQERPPILVTSRGNFGVVWEGLALPYRAKVVVGDQERVMLTPQTSGDCNACHTQTGTQGALGRIIVP
jgi:hypothetical protein